MCTGGASGVCAHLWKGGKCWEFRENRFTFPEGREQDVAERGFCKGWAFSDWGKVMGIAGKSVHFPGERKRVMVLWLGKSVVRMRV